MDKLIFGEIPGVSIGTIFINRAELAESGIHKQRQAGIWGMQDIGACSIVLSGGYEDDIDNMNRILYTGHGGQEFSGGPQVKDQEFSRGNKALALSYERQLPVRVTRGYQIENGPEKGYRYDGLYTVTNYFKEQGISGFYVYRYELVTRT